MKELKESEQKVLLDKYYSIGLTKKEAHERLELILQTISFTPAISPTNYPLILYRK